MVADQETDADLERELRSDLELEGEEQGEAWLVAARGAMLLRTFGNTTLMREQTHETRGGRRSNAYHGTFVVRLVVSSKALWDQVYQDWCTHQRF